MKTTFSIKISGPAGAGMMQAGETLSKALNRLGFFTLMYPEYPSRIRGGDNHVLVVFSSEKHLSPQGKIDLLLAFEKKNFEAHKSEVVEGFGEYEGGELGLTKIAEELGNPLVANTAGLGFIFKVLGFDLKVLKEQIKKDFKGKEEIKEINIKAAEGGYKLGVRKIREVWHIRERRKIVNYSGNEALVEGILKAGCGFAAIYPMTPINTILSLLTKSAVTLFRPEDEIAGINAVIGASYAGERSMVATSGGGFSLMVEALGMAGMAEIPVVVVLGQRTGPSTGMATYSSQADLKFVITAGQGEFPRIVLAPGNVTECFWLGAEAFNLAEHYQVPVILLTDKYLAESRFSAEKEEFEMTGGQEELEEQEDLGNYKRYKFTESGISPRAFPGQVTFLTNSYEHDEYGFSCDEAENRKKMMEKRMGKLRDLSGPARHASQPRLPQPVATGGQVAGVAGRGFEGFEGNEGWKKGITLVGWGSTKEIILDFLQDHPNFNFIHIWRPWPFPGRANRVLKKAARIMVIEENYSGQLADLVERFTFKKVERVLKDDGRPFFKEELKSRLLR